MRSKRGGYTETHTKREAVAVVGQPPIAIAVSFSLGFFHKSQIFSHVLYKAKICNGKTKGLALLSENRLVNGFSLHFRFEAKIAL